MWARRLVGREIATVEAGDCGEAFRVRAGCHECHSAAHSEAHRANLGVCDVADQDW